MNKIKAHRIYLRRLNVEDATEEYCSWLNDKESNKYLETKKATIKDLEIYIKEKNLSENCLFFGIFDISNDNHIGNIKLEPIDYKNKTAELGVLIGDKNYWNKGYGTEVMILLIDHSFQNLDLQKITLGVLPGNENAIKLYKKIGFQIINKKAKSIRMIVNQTDFYDSLC